MMIMTECELHTSIPRAISEENTILDVSLGEGSESKRIITNNIRSGSPGYEEEPEYDPAEPGEPEENMEDEVPNNPDSLMATGDHGTGVVVSGDQSAAKGKLSKDKKIPKEERQTTPYMTKYEKARILGTRALQIRFGVSSHILRNSCWSDLF